MNTNTSYTPGPWKWEQSTATIRSSSNYWLATMDSFEGAVNHEANARLIAAAPEMLSELKAVDALLEQLGYQAEQSFRAGVIATIAKAEGGEA